MEGRNRRVALVNSHAIANACYKYGLASLKSILGADVSLSALNTKTIVMGNKRQSLYICFATHNE